MGAWLRSYPIYGRSLALSPNIRTTSKSTLPPPLIGRVFHRSYDDKCSPPSCFRASQRRRLCALWQVSPSPGTRAPAPEPSSAHERMTGRHRSISRTRAIPIAHATTHVGVRLMLATFYQRHRSACTPPMRTHAQRVHSREATFNIKCNAFGACRPGDLPSASSV